MRDLAQRRPIVAVEPLAQNAAFRVAIRSQSAQVHAMDARGRSSALLWVVSLGAAALRGPCTAFLDGAPILRAFLQCRSAPPSNGGSCADCRISGRGRTQRFSRTSYIHAPGVGTCPPQIMPTLTVWRWECASETAKPFANSGAYMSIRAMRAVLGILVVGLFMVITAAMALFPLFAPVNVDLGRYSDYFSKTASVYTGIVGVVVGYYFGRSTARPVEPSTEATTASTTQSDRSDGG